MMTAAFGEFLKQRRLERRLTLRAFCEAAGVDPANYSKLERGLLLPPRDAGKLKPYEEALGLTPESPEAREMRRLAALDRGELPPGVLADPDLVGKLPALFRTLEGDPVDDRLLGELIETIRQHGHAPLPPLP
jgi:transcriptional regulator with XRE-family HTH domain